jgi:hypothetical protein
MNPEIKLNTIKSVRYGLPGFYIEIPELEEEKHPLINYPSLNILINGTLSHDWFDFDIVTIPKKDSEISFSYPSYFNINSVDSSFENFRFYNNTKINVLKVYGKCSNMDTVHIEWNYLPDFDKDGVPDTIDDFPNDPNKWKKEEEKKEKGFIPGFEIIILLLSVFIFLLFKKKY